MDERAISKKWICRLVQVLFSRLHRLLPSELEPNPVLTPENFPVLANPHASSKNGKNSFAIPSETAPPANVVAQNPGQPTATRQSRLPKATNGDGVEAGVKQSEATQPQSDPGTRRSSRTSFASGSVSRDTSASESKIDNQQTAGQKKLRKKRSTVGSSRFS